MPFLALLRKIKERAPDTVTMMGGANCEGPMGEATHRYFSWVDCVVSGAADELPESVLNCRPEAGRANVFRPRPEAFWPVDALELAERLIR